MLGGLFDALSFLTILPMPSRVSPREGFSLTAAVPWFPLVGALVGGVAGGLRVAFDPLLGRGPSTVVAMVALVAMTGGLHQDALADVADGLGVRGDSERRLEVMRDPRIGAFGALALLLWALLLFSSLEHLGSTRALLTLVAAAAAGRMAAALQGLVAQSAGGGGLGAKLNAGTFATAAASVPTAAIVVAALGPLRGGASLGLCAAVALLTALAARRMLGGSTGDTLGAAIALAELAVCVLMGGMWR
jgi:adenosylcobinamide-GDP ribazoletransferase